MELNYLLSFCIFVIYINFILGEDEIASYMFIFGTNC